VEVGLALRRLLPDQEKPLNPFAGLGLAGLEPPFRVHGGHMQAVELAAVVARAADSGRDCTYRQFEVSA
jgi:hypothetical protein